MAGSTRKARLRLRRAISRRTASEKTSERRIAPIDQQLSQVL